MDAISEASVSKAQPAARRGTILVVEDEELMLRLLKRVLSQQDFEVFTAADGEEAIEIYRAHKQEIDVVLLDLGLPKISGVEVFFKMKEENPNVRVVVASGFLEPEAKAEIARAGVSHFFLKPYIFEELIDALRSMIER